MQIEKIKLNNYLSFKDGLEIDLTYPKGHLKADKPLDKVCFLGQSGTGKTSLLNLIKTLTIDQVEDNCIDKGNLKNATINVSYKYGTIKFYKELNKEGKIIWHGGENYESSDECKKSLENKFSKNIKTWLIYFPFDYINQKITEEIDDVSIKKNVNSVFDIHDGLISPDDNDFSAKKYWDFSDGKDKLKTLWQIIKRGIDEYKKNHNLKNNECLQKQKDVKNGHNNLNQDTLESILAELEKWEKENPNPVQQLAAKYLDIILDNFHLKVKTDLDFDSEDDKGFIKIQQKQGHTIVPHKFLSTGTRQVMYTALPLYCLEPKESIIIFDQPETSLYPNIQWILADMYSKIAGDENQFFYATHSPIIASSFEPWEIIELKFDEETGKVIQRPYYEINKERHIKNYNIFPKYLRWDSIFKKMFDLPNEGNDERLEKLMELAVIDVKLNDPNLKSKDKKILFDSHKDLVLKLDWDYQSYEENNKKTNPL